MQNVDYSSLHYFEGPEWQYLKRGRERFARGPSVRADPLGRCAGVLVYNSQLVLLKAAQVRTTSTNEVPYILFSNSDPYIDLVFSEVEFDLSICHVFRQDMVLEMRMKV